MARRWRWPRKTGRTDSLLEQRWTRESPRSWSCDHRSTSLAVSTALAVSSELVGGNERWLILILMTMLELPTCTRSRKTKVPRHNLVNSGRRKDVP